MPPTPTQRPHLGAGSASMSVSPAITASIAWGCWLLSSRRCCEWPSPDKAWADAEQLFSVNADVFSALSACCWPSTLFGNRAIKWANGTSTVGKAFALSAFVSAGCGSSPPSTWYPTTQRRGWHTARPRTRCLASPKLARARSRVWRWPHCRVVRIPPVSNRSRTPPKKWIAGPEPAEAIPIAISGWRDLLAHLTVAMLLGSNKIAASNLP